MLCPPCRADADAWLEPRRHHVKNTLPANGGISAQKIRDQRRGNYQEWRDRVTYQLDLITRICQTTHQEDG